MHRYITTQVNVSIASPLFLVSKLRSLKTTDKQRFENVLSRLAVQLASGLFHQNFHTHPHLARLYRCKDKHYFPNHQIFLKKNAFLT